jgi:hypothetical protein
MNNINLNQAVASLHDHFKTSCEKMIIDKESSQYNGCSFLLVYPDNRQLQTIFRTAKITPTKTGQFVTLWKRPTTKSPIQPFDQDDEFDQVIILVKNADQMGYFVFDKTILAEKVIISISGSGGKRAIRVYPPWDIADNKQAISIQNWQIQYFHKIPA